MSEMAEVVPTASWRDDPRSAQRPRARAEASPAQVRSEPDSGNRMQGGMEQKMQGWPPDLLSDREIDRIIA